MKRKNGFTLIELIAVLVILAILALIVTPLVMNIIRKARISADKRSIDAYGRSVELAIANYLLDNGDFPTDISQLTIEYSGDEVVCSTSQLNSDSTVYLAGCTVAGRSVEGYTYGSEGTTPEPVTPSYTAYQVGDHVSYNGVTYYVMEDSDVTNDIVKLLKENPLTYSEMTALNLTGITISEDSGYGKVQYGSSTDYSTSTIKQVVDAWKTTAVASGDSATARLITVDDIVTEQRSFSPCGGCGTATGNFAKYDWAYNSNYIYWTSSPASSDRIKYMGTDGRFGDSGISISSNVRPLIELNKSADITKID